MPGHLELVILAASCCFMMMMMVVTCLLACVRAQAGVAVRVHRLPASVSQAVLEDAVAAVCADPKVDGVLLQVGRWLALAACVCC